MNKNKSKLISSVIIVFALGFSFSLHFILADWQSPTANPPGYNTPVPIDIGPDTQAKNGALILNTWGNSQGLIVEQGNFGIGTINPYAKLEVAGGVKVGADSICNASKEGTIRYNPSEPSIDFCNGTNWEAISLKCAPYCPSGYACGSDNCGGTCGTCPSSSNGASYCSGSNVYHNVTSYSCNSSHACASTVTPTLVTTCTNGCSGGACICIPSTCSSLGHNCGGPYSDDCGGTIASCGSCGSNASCSSGTCACTSGWRNCNGNWSDGCEVNTSCCIAWVSYSSTANWGGGDAYSDADCNGHCNNYIYRGHYSIYCGS